MKPGLKFALLLSGCLWTAALSAQTQSSGQKPANPPAAPQQPAPQPGGNPFPEDEGAVPVLPSASAPALPADMDENSLDAAAPAVDRDPVRSPDDGYPGEAGGETQGFSSSRSGLDNIAPSPDDVQPTGKRGRKGEAVIEPPKETPKEDVSVGNYYIDRKDWKGALSRFQSAMVLDPENPEVYWGMAECQRHLGRFAEARENYQKVIDYDPDSRHARDAKKLLKDPELANARPVAQ